jgi:electron transport complex protein RnfC
MAGEAAQPPAISTSRSAATIECLESLPAANLAAWIDRLASCGVRVDRRDSPDLLGQLHIALRRPLAAVFCSVMDVDPSVCLQNAIAAHYPAELLAGVTVLRRACGGQRATLVLDRRAPEGWHEDLRRGARRVDARFAKLHNEYPQADPTLMLFTLVARRLRPGRLPAEQGALLLDAAAAVAVGACVLRNEPMRRQMMAVRDHDRGQSHFLSVPVEMTVAEIAEKATQVFSAKRFASPLFRAGDLLRDQRINGSATLEGGELVLHVASAPPAINPQPCIRCGWCFEACPTRVQPAIALDATQTGDQALAERAGIDACIECGICSYVCPSHLPILGGIRSYRALHRTAKEHA